MVMNRRNFALGAAGLGLTAAVTGCAPSSSSSGGEVGETSQKPVKQSADVIVLGAGVSGLQAAWLLEQQGLSVAVVEGRNRVGGRVMTLTDQPGYPEMGFNTFYAGYGRGLSAAKRVGVELQDVAERFYAGPPARAYIDGQSFDRKEWAAFAGNPFPDSFKSVMPGEVVMKIMMQHPTLADGFAWSDPKNAALDVSLYQVLKTHGFSDAAIQLAANTSPFFGFDAWDVSALMLDFFSAFMKAQAALGPGVWAVKGGNIQFPQAMAKQLKGDILLGREVIAIKAGDSDVTAYCRDGSEFRGKKMVCSLPFSALRNVHLEPTLEGPQARAVAQLGYLPISMVFVTATAPFWEEDGKSPAMWTDTVLGNVMPQRFGKDPKEITGFIVQARANLANYWDDLGAETMKAMVVRELGKLRPAAKGKIEAHSYWSWGEQRFNGGDLSFFQPGQVTDFVNQMALPAGRLHFCGEHTAKTAFGLEGALESSERVALEVLNG